MNHVLVWVGYLCFVVAGVQVIRLIKLHYEEKERSEKEAKKYEQEAQRLQAKVRYLEEEAKRKKIVEEKRKYLQKKKEQQIKKQKSNQPNKGVQYKHGKRKDKHIDQKYKGTPELWGVAGIYANTYITLKREILFGRSYSCNLVFPEEMPRISRRHCLLKYDRNKGMFCLTDLQSSYGTFLGNGKKLKPGESVWMAVNEEFCLGNGERFRVGVRTGS
ncbi:MAG: FHA domain-containing protein [Lachnospiraceae bacterium]|nr:FHA domain-containing protein [Lachnospiraceae bacterium]